MSQGKKQAILLPTVSAIAVSLSTGSPGPPVSALSTNAWEKRERERASYLKRKRKENIEVAASMLEATGWRN